MSALSLFSLLFLLVLCHSGVDSHSACFSRTNEKEVFHLTDNFVRPSPSERDPQQTIFQVIYDEDVPFKVEEAIESALTTLEAILISDVQLSFNVNMTSEGNDWGNSNSGFWVADYPLFLSNISYPNVTQIFPEFSLLKKEINWPLGWGWKSGRIMLTDWQAYERGLIAKNHSEFTLTINQDFMDQLDFNSTDGTDSDKYDFETLVLHQLIHELGFQSILDILDINSTTPNQDFFLYPFDIFRFSYNFPNEAQDIITDPRQLDPTITPHQFWEGSLQSPVPLERGLNYTGYGAAHWLHQNDSIGFGLMDSDIPQGMAIGFSPNDVAALRALGWAIKDNIRPILLSAIHWNDSFVLVHGSLFLGPTIKCGFNQSYVVDPANSPAESGWKEILCPLPQEFQNGTVWVQLSNDGGATWSTSHQVSEEEDVLGNNNDSSSSQLGRSTWLTMLMVMVLLHFSHSF